MTADRKTALLFGGLVLGLILSPSAFAQQGYYPQQPGYYAPQGYPSQGYQEQPAYAPPRAYPQQQPYPAQPNYAPPAQQQPAPFVPQNQLDNLVAPIALYPDPLLSEVLAASTYPLEVVEAEQWLQQHPGLSGQQLIDAARQTGWDPSVQALVAFPDVLALLNRDVQWTTDLGNAFLAQQSDVMAAIQRMRALAEQNGQLQSDQQQVVTNSPQYYDPQYGQGAIQIQPANPQVVYPPAYNPEDVWGPPVVGAYPALPYPTYGYGIGWGIGTAIGSIFTGFLGFGGWGWGLNWFTHSLLLNGLFFTHFGFGGGYGGVWAHNPVHRLGVPYSNQLVANRFGGSYGSRSASLGGYRTFGGTSFGNSRGSGYGGSGYRSFSAPTQTYSRSFAAPSGAYRAPSSGYGSQYTARSFAPSGAYRNNFAERSFSGGGERFSAPRSSDHFSAPHFSSPHFSAPRFSGGGHSSGHSSGGHSGGGGHGGGHHR